MNVTGARRNVLLLDHADDAALIPFMLWEFGAEARRCKVASLLLFVKPALRPTSLLRLDYYEPLDQRDCAFRERAF